MKNTKYIILVILLSAGFLYGQCPEQVKNSNNGKCLELSWQTQPTPLPESIEDISTNEIFYLLSSGPPAMYRLDGQLTQCNHVNSDFSGGLQIGNDGCEYVDGQYTGTLAISLINWEAEVYGWDIIFNWDVLADKGTQIHLEQSIDGEDWRHITELSVEYKGYRLYSVSETFYYRLRIQDEDNNTFISEILRPEILLNSLIYPNPNSTGTLNIESDNTFFGVVVINSSNRVLKLLVLEGLTSYNLTVSDLPAGLYFIKIFTEKGVRTEKLIIY